MARKRGIPVSYEDENDRLESAKPFVNLLVEGLKRGSSSKIVRDILRTIHISACLHAAVRWDKKRQLEGNDLFDFHHAAAALAYCDAFFTENLLKPSSRKTMLGWTSFTIAASLPRTKRLLTTSPIRSDHRDRSR